MEWKKVKLGDIADLKNGKKRPATYGTIPAYGGNGILDYVRESNNENCCIIGRVGAYCGCVYFSQGKCWVSDNAISASAKENSDDKFLFYLLSSIDLHHHHIGGAQPLMTQDIISRIEVGVPSIEDQRRIASILSSLDAQIENNNRINANLEAQAQALFKSWFVDFEPFAADEFIDSEIGEIPSSLTLDTIANIPHSLETGRRPKGGVGEIKEGVPSVGAEHVKGLGAYDFSKTKFIPFDFAQKVKSGIVKGYELLIYKDGGKPGYFIPNFSIFGEGYPFDYCILNEHVFKLDFEGNRAYNAFAYFYFHTDYVMNYLNAEGGKAAIPGINQQAVNSLWIFSPDNPKVKEFGDIVLPMVTKILQNLSENKRLAALRDTLLPKLMKGEIEL